MNGLHQSHIRYSPYTVEPTGCGWSDGRSGEMRVSYFDPRTGEPCEGKPEPLGNRTERGARKTRGKARALEAARKKGRPSKPVMVDGEEHESITAAAHVVGGSKNGLSRALRSGSGTYKGHRVEYKEKSCGTRGAANEAERR